MVRWFASSIQTLSMPLQFNGQGEEFLLLLLLHKFTECMIYYFNREGFDIEKRTNKTVEGNSVYFTVKNVSGDDAGEFFCVANNGIGMEVKNSSFLLVRRKFCIL